MPLDKKAYFEKRDKAEDERWIKWLLSFQSRDLDLLTKRSWKILSDEVERFGFIYFVRTVRTRGRVVGVIPEAYVQPLKSKTADPGNLGPRLTPTQLKEIQRELRGALIGLLSDNASFKFVIPGSVKKIWLQREPGMGKRIVEIHEASDWPSVFWRQVAYLLKTYGSILRQCDECKTIFLKTKRKVYCSSKCSQRVRTRRWYATHKEEAKEKRRQSYLEKIKKVHPRAKVKRRSLKGDAKRR